MKNLVQYLKPAKQEEAVKHYFANFFNISPYDTKNGIDLYTGQVTFEFKTDADLLDTQALAKCFAQVVYYVRRCKYGLKNENRPPSNSVCVVTKNFAAILPTETFKAYYTAENYDWLLPASNPCKKLIAALAADNALRECVVYDFEIPASHDAFVDLLKNRLAARVPPYHEKIEITARNFFTVFEYWQKKFGKFFSSDKRKDSEYFMTDIEFGKTEFTSENRALFRMSDGSTVEKYLPTVEYNFFWSIYEKIDSQKVISAIRQRMDRMTEEEQRRRTGEFYTPMEFADVAIEYLKKTLKRWWKDENFRLWDMAAGSGNLEWNLPAEALPKCYISTLLEDDAAYCKKTFPTATVFQYDYLNDDVAFIANPQAAGEPKMPKNLVDDLKNPKIKWLIFINPPYATANNYERDKSRINKDAVSMTAIRELMTADGLGNVSQELFSQFLYRISREFKDRKAWLGMFSKIKYINANNDQKLRDSFFKYKYERGFIFNSKNFAGCKAEFPVGFLIWNLAKNIPLESQQIVLDIFNEQIEKFAKKTVSILSREEFLNKWVKRPRCTKKFPPMKSALNFGFDAKNLDDLIAEDFLASMMFKGNDFLNQNGVALLSGPYSSGHDISVTPENFCQCMVVHMVRRLPKATWLNDRDQFMQPTGELSAEFICDAVVWSLFAPSNQTASLRNVEYEGQIYQLKNNLYPFLLSEIRSWKCSVADIAQKKALAQDDRFAALWLAEHAAEISPEARAVLEAGKELYKYFYAHMLELHYESVKIEDWDVGWYQVRMSAKDKPRTEKLQAAMKNLSEKLLPQIYELGFLRDEVENL